MKILTTLLFFSLFALDIFGQSNAAFNYQAVARDQNGEVLGDQDIDLRIKILQNGINEEEGSTVYAKYYTVTSNQFGLVNLEIDETEVLYGALNGLQWGNHDFYLQIEMDIDHTGDCNQLIGGENCKLMGSSKLLSVPHAMYAEKAGTVDDENWINVEGNTTQAQIGNIGIGTLNPLQKLDLRGGLFMAASGFVGADQIQNFPESEPNNNDFFALIPTIYDESYSDLRLYIEDNTLDRFSIHGNSCGIGPCGDLSNSQLIATFLGNGKVGLGTSDPKRTLHNTGDYYGRGNVFLHARDGDGQNGTAHLQARDDSGSSSIGLRLRTQNMGEVIDAIHITPDGRIGINHNAPTGRFTIQGDTLNDLTLKALDNTADQGIAFQNAGTSYNWNIFRRDAGDSTANLIFAGNDSNPVDDPSNLNPYLTLQAGGNIGIGTETPAAKVQVKDGDIYLEDINGGIIMTSPNEQCWRVTIGDDGEFEKVMVGCPE